MCRIAGIVTEKKHSLKNYLRVKAMCDSLAHGGPDGDGIFLDPSGKVCLGHRRLAILDLSDAGHQPMEHANFWLSFNGEIYNFRELREELEQKGFSFDTETDTEVILKAYHSWGTSAFARFEGMFAFALADLPAGKTFLVRGQAGIKPLYYSTNNNTLIFSSEVKALAHCGYEMKEDKDWKILFLAFGHIPEPYTTLEGVRMLPKGHYLEWDNETCEHEIKSYFGYQYSSKITDRTEAVALIREKLKAAVERHLLSNAPIGVFLSGGTDSSIITLLANETEQANLRTLSVNFTEAQFDEKPFQKLISNITSGEHTDYLITKEAFSEHFDEVLRSMDQPSTDGINSWFITKYAKENGLKAVLSGLGADEYFGGYPSFDRARTISWLKMLPKGLLRLTEKHFSNKVKRISYLSMTNPVGEYLFLRGCFTPQVIADVLRVDGTHVMEVLERVPMDPQINQLKKGNRISWFETNLYMQNQLLKDSDSMSMCHGIELRVPFLDHELVKTILSIDPKIKFNSKQKKQLLIDAFADVLPEAIWNRKKMGFTFPFQTWMQKLEKLANEDQYMTERSKSLMRLFSLGKLHWSAAFALYLVNSVETPSEPDKATAEVAAKKRTLQTIVLENLDQIEDQELLNKYSLN